MKPVTIRIAAAPLLATVLLAALTACAPSAGAGGVTSGAGPDTPPAGATAADSPCDFLAGNVGYQPRALTDVEAELGVEFSAPPDCIYQQTGTFDTSALWVTDDPKFIDEIAAPFARAIWADVSVYDDGASFANGEFTAFATFYPYGLGDYKGPYYDLTWAQP